MANNKKNGALINGIIILTSALAGLGIWTTVSDNDPSGSNTSTMAATAATVTDEDFSDNDGFLNSGPQSSYIQPRPATRIRTRGS